MPSVLFNPDHTMVRKPFSEVNFLTVPESVSNCEPGVGGKNLESENADMQRILEVIKLVFEMHKGQWYGDAPYITHLFGVASRMKTVSEIIVALVHDMYEDTHCSLVASNILDSLEFAAARLLTKTSGMDFVEYIQKIKANPLARNVKIGDSSYNLESCYMPGGKRGKIQEYTQILRFLKGPDEIFKYINKPILTEVQESLRQERKEMYRNSMHLIERPSIDLDRVLKAVELAFKSHAGQWYGDAPYITHLFGVASRLTTESEIIVGILHDAFERGYCLVRESGFVNEVEFEALRLLSKPPGMTYDENIIAIGRNQLATSVKISELKFNLKTCELNGQKPENIPKYNKALAYLESITLV
jgi:hypothetical protein